MTHQFDEAFMKTIWRHWRPKDHMCSLLWGSLMALHMKFIVLISLLMQLLSQIREQSAVRQFSFCYSEHFIRESFFPFFSFTCTLDGGLLCEASEGQRSCNCVRTASVGRRLANGPNARREENCTQGIFAREYFFFSFCAWAEYWFSAGGKYELTDTANILTGSF